MIRVLHVDDDQTDHYLTEINLHRQTKELELIWVESAGSALAVLKKNDFDCILSDYQMPEKNGVELLKLVREENLDLPFIFLTGQGNEQIAIDALRNGADDYFTKDAGFAHYHRLAHSIKTAVSAYRERRSRKQIERSLFESELKCQKYIEASPLAFFVADEEGNYLEVNQAACDLLGYSEDELLNLTIPDLNVPPENEPPTYGFEQLKKKGVYHREGCLRKKDGSVINVEIDAAELGNGRFMAYCSDITERIKAQEQIEHVNALLKTKNNIGQVIVKETDVDSLLQKACELLVTTRQYLGCSLAMRSENDDEYVVSHGAGSNKLDDGLAFSKKAISKAPPCIQQVLLTGEIELVHDASDCNGCERKAGKDVQGHSTVCIPMKSEGEMPGILFVAMGAEQVHTIDKEVRDLLEQIAADLAYARAKLLTQSQHEKTQSLLNAAIAQSEAGILIADAPSGRIRVANPAALNIRGGEAGLLTGIDIEKHAEIWQTFKPDGSPYASEELPLSRAILKGETIVNEEVIIRDEQGNEHFVAANATPVRDHNGETTAAIVIFHDITESKLARQQLEESQRILAQAVDIANLGSWMIDLRTEQVSASERAYQIYGVKPGTSITLDDIQRIRLPEYAEYMDTEFQKLIKSGGTYTVDFQIKRPIDGETRWIHSEAQYDRQKSQVFGFIRDITDSRQKEEELRIREAQWRSLTEHFPNGALFLCGKDMRYKAVGGMAFKDIGIDPEEIVGRHIREPFPDIWENWQAVFEAALEGVPGYYEDEYGGRLYSNQAIPVVDDSGDIQQFVVVTLDITEQKRAEQELERSREEYRLLIENQADLVIRLDEKGRFLYASPSYCRAIEQQAEDLTGMEVQHFVHEDDKVAFKDILNKLNQPPHTALVEQRTKTKKGWRWIAWSYTAVRSGEDTINGVVGVGRDITDRRAMESHLRASEDKHRSVYLHSPVPYQSLDEHGVILEVNPAWVKVLGYGREEVLGTRFADIVHPDDHDDLLSDFPEFIRKGEVRNIVRKLVRKDGQSLKVLYNGQVERWPDGQFRRTHCDFMVVNGLEVEAGKPPETGEERRPNRDVPDSELELEKARESLNLHTQIANAFLLSSEDDLYYNVLQVLMNLFKAEFGYFGYINDDGDLVCPSMTRDVWHECQVPEKSITFPKDTWGGLWGESLIQKAILVKNEHLEAPAGHIKLENALAVPIVYREEVIGQFVIANREGGFRENEERLAAEVAESLAPILDASQTKIIQQRQLRKFNEELQAFTYAVSHDLKAPARQLLGFSELLKADFEEQLGNHGNSILSNISKAAQNVNVIIESLLRLSRVQRKKLEIGQVDLSMIAFEIGNKLKNQYPEASLQVEEGLVVQGDHDLLFIVLENLLGNAFKYSSKVDKPEIEFKLLEKSGKHWKFVVSDNGSGFEQHLSESIFAPFVRAHSSDEFQGTGIGLATVKKIIENHGGNIWAEGAAGEGASFYFTLPVEAETAN